VEDAHNKSLCNQSQEYFSKMKQDIQQRKQTQLERQEVIDEQLSNQASVSQGTLFST